MTASGTRGSPAAGRAGFARRALSVAGSLTAAVGLLHLVVAVASYDRLTLDALWFAGSGLAVVLIGVLTLLARGSKRGTAARWAAVGANAAGFVLATTFCVLTRWKEPQGPLLVALFVAAGVAALWRSSDDDC